MSIKETKYGCILDVFVSCNKPRFCIEGLDEWTNSLKISVKEKALEGKANKELEKELERFFEKPAAIISGHKSRRKKIFLKAKKSHLLKKMAQKLN